MLNCVSPKRSVGILPHPAPQNGNGVGHRIVAGVVSPGKMSRPGVGWVSPLMRPGSLKETRRGNTGSKGSQPRGELDWQAVVTSRKGAWILSPSACGCEAPSNLY